MCYIYVQINDIQKCYEIPFEQNIYFLIIND